jgi:hypothetical protein
LAYMMKKGKIKKMMRETSQSKAIKLKLSKIKIRMNKIKAIIKMMTRYPNLSQTSKRLMASQPRRMLKRRRPRVRVEPADQWT